MMNLGKGTGKIYLYSIAADWKQIVNTGMPLTADPRNISRTPRRLKDLLMIHLT